MGVNDARRRSQPGTHEAATLLVRGGTRHEHPAARFVGCDGTLGGSDPGAIAKIPWPATVFEITVDRKAVTDATSAHIAQAFRDDQSGKPSRGGAETIMGTGVMTATFRGVGGLPAYYDIGVRVLR